MRVSVSFPFHTRSTLATHVCVPASTTLPVNTYCARLNPSAGEIFGQAHACAASALASDTIVSAASPTNFLVVHWENTRPSICVLRADARSPDRSRARCSAWPRALMEPLGCANAERAATECYQSLNLVARQDASSAAAIEL